MRAYLLLAISGLTAIGLAQDTVQPIWNIAQTPSAGTIAISPDGNRVAVCFTHTGYGLPTQSDVEVFDVPTGKLMTTLGFRGEPPQFQVALGNGDVAYYGLPGHGIWSANYVTNVRTQLTDGDSPFGVQMSPDGSTLAYLTLATDGTPNALDFVNLSNLDRITVPLNGYSSSAFQWFPDSSRVALPGPNVYQINGIHTMTRSADLGGRPMVGPDNKTIYIYEGENLTAYQIGAGQLWTTTVPSRPVFNPILSHDGGSFIVTVMVKSNSAYLKAYRTTAKLQVQQSYIVLPDIGVSSTAVLDPNRNAIFLLRVNRSVPAHLNGPDEHCLERLTYDTLGGGWTTDIRMGDSGGVGGAKATVSSDGGLTTSIVEIGNYESSWFQSRNLQDSQLTLSVELGNYSYDKYEGGPNYGSPGVCSPDGTAGMAGELYLDVTTGKYTEMSETFWAEAMADNGRGAWLDTDNNSLQVRQVKKGVSTTIFTRPAGTVAFLPRLAFTDTGNRLAFLNPEAGTIEVWDVLHNVLVGQVPRPAVLGAIFLRANYLGIQSFAGGTDLAPQGAQTLSLYTWTGTLVKTFTQPGVVNPDNWASVRRSIAQISFDGNWIAMSTTDAQPGDDPNVYSILNPSLWLIRFVDGQVVKQYRGGALGTTPTWLDFSRNNQRLAVETSAPNLFMFELPRILSGISLSDSTVNGGGTVQGTVTLLEPAPAGGVTVRLSANPELVDIPQNVRVLKGATTATFNITAHAVGTSTDVSIQATLDGLSYHTPLTINP